MDIEERLNQVADRYREQGYQVVLRPGPDDLPPFAKDFKVEILAKRSDGNVLASVKASARDFETDPELSRYAEVIGKHPHWRYDVFAVGPSEIRPPEYKREAADLTEAEIAKALDTADRLYREGFAPQSVTAAWAAAESAMRYRLKEQGSEVGWGASPMSMLNELVSSGALSSSDFRRFRDLSHLRNVIVHGFSVPEIDPSVVPFLANVTRQLLTEANAAEKAS